jgi:hypothetical protein
MQTCLVRTHEAGFHKGYWSFVDKQIIVLPFFGAVQRCGSQGLFLSPRIIEKTEALDDFCLSHVITKYNKLRE